MRITIDAVIDDDDLEVAHDFLQAMRTAEQRYPRELQVSVCVTDTDISAERGMALIRSLKPPLPNEAWVPRR